jgi:ectoine hydroxylase-related dioxygenase (phytanoyl-CoA dioxygenase family)
MREMDEATLSQATPAGILQKLRRDGYVLIRQLADQSAALEVSGQMLSALESDGWIRTSRPTRHTAERHTVESPGRGRESDKYWRTYGSILGLEDINQICWSSGIHRLMASLLGERSFCFPQKIPRIGFPLAHGWPPTPPHRDNRGGPWIRDMLTVWLALDHIPLARGGLAVLRGSQSYRYVLGSEDTEEPAACLPGQSQLPDDASADWVTADFAPGDAVVFHAYTIHKGMPNRTEGVRLSIDSRWQAPGAPAHVQSLMPHHYFDRYPRIPGWAELSAGWSRKDWCGYPPDLEVIDTKWPNGHDLRVPRSDLVDIMAGATECWRADTREIDRYRTTPHVLPAAFTPVAHSSR